MRRRRGFVAALFGIAALFITGMRGRLRRYAVSGESMAPTLANGDWTLALRLSMAPRRGVIVVFDNTARPGMELVKRVIGLPGEKVTIANGQVHVDGSILAEPWADGPTRPDGEWLLGSGEVFVLGDARSHSSADSRLLGPVNISTVGWQISARYWPLASIGRI